MSLSQLGAEGGANGDGVRDLARADAAVATGRGFMEALAFGRYAFFPVKDERLPCFADAPPSRRISRPG